MGGGLKVPSSVNWCLEDLGQNCCGLGAVAEIASAIDVGVFTHGLEE